MAPVNHHQEPPSSGLLGQAPSRVESVMRRDEGLRQVNVDWGERAPVTRLVLDQDRIAAMGLTSASIGDQIHTLLNGMTVAELREGIRKVALAVRSDGDMRLDPARLGDFTLVGREGQRVPLAQVARVETTMEEPVLRRRDRVPTVTVSADLAPGLQPPQASAAVMASLQPILASLPEGYRIVAGGPVEEAEKANASLAPIFPVMLVLMMTVIIIQVRSLKAMAMVILTAPLGLVGVVPTLLLSGRPFGFTAIIGLIGLAGILMRNTLILIGQIHDNEREGLEAYDAVVEATVQRARPVLLTALAAVLAFIPLTGSVFWGAMAWTLIGGTLGGTILTIVFLPALYAIAFRIRPPDERASQSASVPASSIMKVAS